MIQMAYDFSGVMGAVDFRSNEYAAGKKFLHRFFDYNDMYGGTESWGVFLRTWTNPFDDIFDVETMYGANTDDLMQFLGDYIQQSGMDESSRDHAAALMAMKYQGVMPVSWTIFRDDLEKTITSNLGFSLQHKLPAALHSITEGVISTAAMSKYLIPGLVIGVAGVILFSLYRKLA